MGRWWVCSVRRAGVEQGMSGSLQRGLTVYGDLVAQFCMGPRDDEMYGILGSHGEFFSGLDKIAGRQDLGSQVLLLGTCQKKGGNEVVSCYFSVRSTTTYKWRWTFSATPWQMRCCSSTWPPSSRPATSAHGPPWCVQHPYSASRANRGSSLFLSITTRLLNLWFIAQPGPAMHMFAGFPDFFSF